MLHIKLFSQRVIKLSLFLALTLMPSMAMALQLNELVIEREGNTLRGTIVVDQIQRAQRDLRVSIVSAEEYETQGINYNNFIRDLEVAYRSSGRRSGRISISFPYDPIDSFDLLLEVKWESGEIQRRYNVKLGGILPQQEGSIIASITPTDVPVRRDNAASTSGASNQEPPVSTIETIEGDSWHNLAQAIRQAYLRDKGVSQEQVMVALREKNANVFDGRRVRIGVALSLPNYYEVEIIGQQEAQREIYGALRQARKPNPRLEIVASSTVGQSDSIVSQDSSPVQNDVANNVAEAETLEIKKRESVDTVERLSLIRKQIEQIDKLIDLKSTQLSSLQNEVDYRETLPQNEIEFTQTNITSNTVEALLGERWQVLRREFSTKPIFWVALIMCTLVIFIFLLWLLMKRHKSRGKRSRMKLMRDLQQGNVPAESSSNRPLIFEETDDSLSIPARLSSSVPEATRRPKRKTRSKDDDFLQDNLTNANLDLARAYINMGEVASAKSLLDNVISSGSDAEKAQARRLLEEI